MAQCFLAAAFQLLQLRKLSWRPLFSQNCGGTDPAAANAGGAETGGGGRKFLVEGLPGEAGLV
jgi:hypothetical protein